MGVKRGIEASTTVDVPFELVRRLLSEDPGLLAGDDVTPGERRQGRFRSELGVELPAGAGIRQAIDIEIGAVEAAGDAAEMPLAWQSSERDRLFPVFDGVLRASREGPDATRVLVQGTYTVPLGPVGRFGDGLIGRRLARQSFTAFLQDVARRLDTEVHRPAATVARQPAPYPIHLRELAADQ